jgi:hypothetical protein
MKNRCSKALDVLNGGLEASPRVISPSWTSERRKRTGNKVSTVYYSIIKSGQWIRIRIRNSVPERQNGPTKK